MSLPALNFLRSPFVNARDPRYPVRAIVSHRIVGTLKSARGAFGVVLGGKSRNASTHFGIGYIDGVLVIDQFVDLSDMAWGNGDVRDPTWSRIIPGVNPNLYTVSIEHEDGGSGNGGRVSDEIWRASMALQKLITSGDGSAIRAAGIRVRSDTTIAQLAAIPKDESGFIDHNQISGPNKPYCFRRWLDDPGFVEGSPSRRDRLLAALNGTPPEDDMATPPLRFKPELWKTSASGADLRREAVMLTTNKVGFIPPGTVVFTVGESDDGIWRLAVAEDPASLGEEDLFWVVRKGPLIPLVQGGDPALLVGIQAVVEARLAGEPAPGDAGAAKRIGLAATHLANAGVELTAAQKALQG